MGDKISVIVPIYKVEPYLRQCLDSVVGQTYRDLEIILIDDGSPDRCGAICDEYAAKDARITVIHKDNGGLCAARNDGLKKATGDWIAFVDSDDWCEPEYYEQLLKANDGHDAEIICAGGRYWEYPDKQLPGRIFTETTYFTSEKDIEELIVRTLISTRLKDEKGTTTLGTPWDKLYNAAFIRRIELQFDTSSRAFEDVWFNFQAFYRAKSVIGCAYIGYHYRQVKNSIVWGYNAQKPKIGYDFIVKLHTFMQRQGASANVSQAIDARALSVIRNSLDCCYFHPSNKTAKKEIADQIKELKQWTYYHDAIWSPNDQYLSRNRKVLKYTLRMPWIWPLRIVYSVKKKVGP